MVRHVGDVAKLDVEREARTGIPEVVLAEGKLDHHLRDIARAFAEAKGRILVSRLPRERLALFDGLGLDLTYHEAARLLVVATPGAPAGARGSGRVGLLAAGTATGMSAVPAARSPTRPPVRAGAGAPGVATTRRRAASW